ncbi:MAG: tryptophan 7-halogenase [Actinobacteria bacterium]|nr:tryptophan 7-halogenase [Actinomycetota bacterium]
MSAPGPFGRPYDALIIGGGPAGSTVGTLLARRGWRVGLLERARMPRRHVGESLLPGTLAALDDLGVLQQIETAGFTKKYGATYVWGRTREPWTIKFAEVAHAQAYAYQVSRPEFDKVLLEHARAHGVEVFEEAHALRALGSAEGVRGVRARLADGRAGAIEAPLTIDATGQDGLIGRQFRLREFNNDLRHVALFGHWTGARSVQQALGSTDARDAGNILIAAVDDGWIWHIPLKDGICSVGLVTEPSAVGGLSVAARTAHYLKVVAGCRESQAILGHATWISGEVDTLSDWSFFCRRFHGPGYALVGDAACFVDPILSTGVTLAVNGASRAARALDTARRDPALGPLAMDWYQGEYRTIAEDFVDLATHWYAGHRSPDAWFWRAHRLVDPAKNLSIRQAFVYLSSGVTGVAGAGANLRFSGGFSPRQLQVTYDHLTLDLSHAERQAVGRAVAANQPAVARVPRSPEQLLAARCRLIDGVAYRMYMEEDGAWLKPVTWLIRHAPNGAREHLSFPAATASILNLLDGARTGNDVVGVLAERTNGRTDDPAADLRDAVARLLAEMYDLGALVEA